MRCARSSVSEACLELEERSDQGELQGHRLGSGLLGHDGGQVKRTMAGDGDDENMGRVGL